MSNKLLALKLVLNALGVGTNIDDVTARKEKQKAIYLAKALAGLDLGYSYGWYIRGPYSPSLANDYYELQNESLEEGTLRQDLIQSLEGIRTTVLESPLKPPQLDRPDWLELLASWHYLINVSRYNIENATTKLNEQKPHVAPYIQAAIRVLG